MCSNLPSGQQISQLDNEQELLLGKRTCFIPNMRHECLRNRRRQSRVSYEQQARHGSKSLSRGQNQDVAHESIWSGTFNRSTSLQKLQSDRLERMLLSSIPKTHSKVTSLSLV